MKRITIDKKEYTFEFTIEASLYDECSKSMMDMFVKGGVMQSAAETNDIQGALDSYIDTLAEMPQRTLTLFYAGLLEHHGNEGDRSIQSKSDAKRLLASYLREQKKSFKDVMEEMMELMADDNFFELIGLTQVADETTKEEKNSKKAGKSTSEEQ